MKLRITAVCDIGCVRENNEDMVLVGRKLIRDDKLQMSFALNGRHPVFLIAVADGLGGANAGEVASRMVLEHFREHICRLLPGLDREGLKIAVSSLALGAHLKLTEEAFADPAKSGMGTTLVALLYYQGRLVLINAGDSRLYRFRNGALTQLSTDHSLRNLVGSLAPANVITNCFGAGNAFYADVEPAGEEVLNGDLFLLCSDGLSGALADREIEEMLDEEGYEDALLAAAKQKGGLDNISYVLVEVSGVQERRLVT